MTIKHRPIESDKPAQFDPILILTVTLEREYDVIEKSLNALGATKQPPTYAQRLLNITRWTLETTAGYELKISTAFLNRMGNAGSSLETYIYLNRISPMFVFLCGIAGSLDPNKIKLGDVVIAHKVDWWKLNKLSSETFEHCYDMGGKYFRINRDSFPFLDNDDEKEVKQFVNQYRTQIPSNVDNDILVFRKKEHDASSKQWSKNEIHMGDIVSWEYVLSDAGIRQDIIERSPTSLAIEMEGGGFTYALKRRREELQKFDSHSVPPSGFIFRGISDLCDRKDLTHENWGNVAMHNAAAAIMKFLDNYFSEDRFVRKWESGHE